MQLAHTRFIHADLVADLLHRHFAVVVEPDHLLLAPGQRLDGRLHAILDLAALVGGVRTLRLRGQQRRRKIRFVGVIGVGQRRGGLDGVDADDGAAQALFVGADLGGQVRQRRLASQFAAQRLARGLELAALTTDAARPGVLAKRVDHRATHAALGKRLELDATVRVEAVGRVNQADDAILHEVADINRVRHRGRHAAGKGLDKRKTGNNALTRVGGGGGERHRCSP